MRAEEARKLSSENAYKIELSEVDRLLSGIKECVNDGLTSMDWRGTINDSSAKYLKEWGILFIATLLLSDILLK